MIKQYFFILFLTCFSISSFSQVFEIKAFSIYAPLNDEVEEFVKFVDEVLAPGGVNTIIIQIDYGYEWKSRPELRAEKALSESQVKLMLAVCRKHGIKLIPQMNMIGHQSVEGHSLKKLLEVYPEFDETPHVKMPEKWVWPNDDDLYCKSYCTRHPDVHAVLFDLINEAVEVFETKDFHAGLDEIFYLGDEKCPRCKGFDHSELLVDEIRKIHGFLANRGVRMWMWGDRLIDGRTTGIGMWEASYNHTWKAIDWLPKDILICDWHYKKAIPTAAYFAMKGFDVIVCPWNQPEVSVAQGVMMKEFIVNSNEEMAQKYKGMMQTIWTPVNKFIKQYKLYEPSDEKSEVATLKATLEVFKN